MSTHAPIHPPVADRESDWIEWTGGSCPVSGDTLVQVRYRPRYKSAALSASAPAHASFFSIGAHDWWRHGSVNRENDIIAYRVVRP